MRPNDSTKGPQLAGGCRVRKNRCHEQRRSPSQRLRNELRRASVAGPVAASARSLARVSSPGGWVDLARTLERGLFDGLFLAESSASMMSSAAAGGGAASCDANASQRTPAARASHGGQRRSTSAYGVTVNLSYEPPFPFARRMSTLDHLTDGRIGWNVVTGYLEAPQGMGRGGSAPARRTYAVAEDYMEVVYKLWEGSWADDAVVADAAKGVLRSAPTACASSP